MSGKSATRKGINIELQHTPIDRQYLGAHRSDLVLEAGIG